MFNLDLQFTEDIFDSIEEKEIAAEAAYDADPARYWDHVRYMAQEEAAALYSGGWRAEDREEMQKEYTLTEDEADEIIRILKRLEEDEKEE